MFKFLKTLLGGGDRLESIPTSSSQKSQEQPFKHPSKAQREECERLGLEIKQGMSSRDVWQMVNDAKKDPRKNKGHSPYFLLPRSNSSQKNEVVRP